MNRDNIHTEMPVLERFVVLLYHKTSSKYEVNESRFELFSAMNRQIDNIPPTAASLVEHTKRAVFQANIWHQINRKETNELDPASFGLRELKENGSLIGQISLKCPVYVVNSLNVDVASVNQAVANVAKRTFHVLFFVNVVETVGHLSTLSSKGGGPPLGFFICYSKSNQQRPLKLGDF